MQRTSTRFIGCMWRRPSVRLLLTLQHARIGQRQLATTYSSDKASIKQATTQTAAAAAAAVTANTNPSNNTTTTKNSSSSSSGKTTNTNITTPSSSPTATLTAKMQARPLQPSGNATQMQHSANMQRVSPTHYERPRSANRSATSKMQQSSSSSYTQRSKSFERPRHIMREDNMWRDPPRVETKWLRPRDPARYKPDFGLTEPHTLRKQFMRSPDERTRDAMGRDWELTMRMESNRRRRAMMEQQQKEQDIARTIQMRNANKDRKLAKKDWKRESHSETDTKPTTD